MAPTAAPSLSATGRMTSWNFSDEPSARPPEMMILAEVSSGRSLSDSRFSTKVERPGLAAAPTRLDRSRAAFASRLEGGRAHRDHLLGVARLHRLDGVAGIDRPLERVGRDDLDDLGDLHHVEQGGDARHDVLAGGGRRRDDRVVAVGHADDQRGKRFGQPVFQFVGLGQQHLGHACQLGGGVGRGLGALAGDQHMHVGADLQRGASASWRSGRKGCRCRVRR